VNLLDTFFRGCYIFGLLNLFSALKSVSFYPNRCFTPPRPVFGLLGLP